MSISFSSLVFLSAVNREVNKACYLLKFLFGLYGRGKVDINCFKSVVCTACYLNFEKSKGGFGGKLSDPSA